MFDSIKRWRRRHSEVEKNIQDELAYHLEALANEQAIGVLIGKRLNLPHAASSAT